MYRTDRRVDVAQRDREANDPFVGSFLMENRLIEHLLRYGRAISDALREPHGKGLDHFGPSPVIFHRD